MGDVRRWMLAFGLVVLPGVSATAQTLPADPNLATGKLENGLSYVFRRHANPPGKVALLVRVATGSLNETDQQRGLAHFLEHMAFNGSENFPPGKAVEYFESIGMEFGDDINAFTSFEETVYMLLAPDIEPATLDKAMLCLSDQAFRLSLLKEEIDKERGVILEEVRSDKSPEQRIQDELFPKLFPGSRFANHLPLGDEQQIASFGREDFATYYRKWYRPEHMTLIVIGDADPQAQMPLIRKHFGTYRCEDPVPVALGAQIGPFSHPRGMVVSDPEIATGEVEMITLAPVRDPLTTEAQYSRALLERMGSWIVNRRLEESIRKGEASFREGQVGVADFFRQGTAIHGSVDGQPESWARMLGELVVAVHRAVEHGFTAGEWEQAKKAILVEAEHAVEQESTREAQWFLMRYNKAASRGDTILSARQEWDVLHKLLPQATVERVSRTFAENFAPEAFAYIVTLPRTEGLALPSDEDVLAVAQTARAQKTEPPVDPVRPDSILEKLPEPGQFAEQSTDSDLGITSAWLENGIRVHHRFMDYHKDQVLVRIHLAGGEIEENAGNHGISEAAVQAFNQPATGRLTSTDVRDLTTGKNFEMSGESQADALVLDVSGSPRDLEVAFQLAYALLTEAKLEASAFDVWNRSKIEELEEGETQPLFHAIKSIRSILGGDDPRLVVLTGTQVRALTREASQQWLDRLRTQAPIEVAVVGDMDWATAQPLLLRYLGSLPPRPRTADRLETLRTVRRPPGPHGRMASIKTVTPVAFVLAGFLGCEERAVSDARALDLASNVLSTRLIKDIREEKQLVYSIEAANRPSRAYRDAGLFFAGAPTDPDKATRLADELAVALADFARTGPTPDEVNVAKKQIANRLSTDRKEPAYWLAVLANLDYHRKSLADIQADETAYQALSAGDVSEAFRKYHEPDRLIRVVVVPQSAASTQPTTIPAASAPASEPAGASGGHP